MTQIPFEHTAGSTHSLPGLRAWLRDTLARMTRERRGDAPTRHTDAEIWNLYYRNRGHKPDATDAMTQNALRAGLWGRY